MFLNPAGTELPVMPVEAFRAKLKEAKGSIIDVAQLSNSELEKRIKKKWQMKRNGPGQYDLHLEEIPYGKGFAKPKEVNIRKGSKNVALERKMVEFVVNDPISWQLENYLSSTRVPDEHFYQSLIEVAKSKAAMRTPKDYYDVKYLRYSVWQSSGEHCHGQMIREVCNFAVKDLKGVQRANSLTANKFNLDVDPLAVLCHLKYLKQYKYLS